MKHSFIENRFLAGVLIIVCFVVTGYALSGEVWSEVKDNIAYVHHDSAVFNCCPEMVFEIKIDGFQIDIFEQDTLAACDCICDFDFTHKLEGLEPGTYHARVWESYYKGEEYFLSGTTDFTILAKLVPFKTDNLRSDCGGWSGVGEQNPEISDFRVGSPALTEVVISYGLTLASGARIELYNVLGVRVRTLYADSQGVGEHVLVWDTRDDAGIKVPRGTYFVLLRAGADLRSLPLIVLR